MTDRSRNLNRRRLVTTRLLGYVTQPRIRSVMSPSGVVEALPGQGGVVTNIRMGDALASWQSDHLEPGASIGHSESATNFAIQVLSCIGNRTTVVAGAAAGASGYVFGKHGAVLVMFDPATLRLLAPGDAVVIDACGVGLAVDGAPWLTFHSCSPEFAAALLDWPSDDRARVRVRALLPPESAAAGIGMAVEAYNLDVTPEVSSGARLAFGDVVALVDHDHRYGRQYRRGWSTVGVLCHGRSVGGGHGFGFVSLLTAPTERLEVDVDEGFRGRELFEALSGGAAGR